jgi:cytochrome c biogenesis protein CcmG, thiol:disulfide interchange protein DsbE
MAGDPGGKGVGRGVWLRRVLQAGAIVIVVLLVGLLVQQTLAQQEGRHLVSQVKAGRTPIAPDFDLPVLLPQAETWPATLRRVLADGSVSLRELRGYPVVVNFWPSWCVPCKAEAPRFVAAAKAYAGEVVFLGIDVQDFKSDARRFLERYQTNYVSVRNRSGSIYCDYGLTRLPETFFLDAPGRVIMHLLREVSEGELAAGIAAALEGKASAA